MALAFLIIALVYFALAGAVLHVDEKAAVPWASPWRTRAPKLFTVGGPALFVLAFAMAAAGLPAWTGEATLVGALVAPWIGGVLITVEWLRRRAEDRTTGLTRPERARIR
jgi:hypothetical protein